MKRPRRPNHLRNWQMHGQFWIILVHSLILHQRILRWAAPSIKGDNDLDKSLRCGIGPQESDSVFFSAQLGLDKEEFLHLQTQQTIEYGVGLHFRHYQLKVNQSKPLPSPTTQTLLSNLTTPKVKEQETVHITNTREQPLTTTSTCSGVLQINAKDAIAFVFKNDTTLVPPKRDNNIPLIAPITAYTWKGNEYDPSISLDCYERPIYKNVNRDNPDFWKYIVDELLLARVPLVLLASRGCKSKDPGVEDGIMCPRRLRHFLTAVRSTPGARDILRIGMFDDTNTYRFQVNTDGAPMDLSNRMNWDYFWSFNIKVFFETIPRSMWFFYNGMPIVMEWTLRPKLFKNMQGNASAMITWLKAQFRTRFGVEPLFILQDTWFENDRTLTSAHAFGKHGWFKPRNDIPSSVYSYQDYNGRSWGVVAPGFRNGKTLRGCGSFCREVSRHNGDTLRSALAQARNEDNIRLVALEGWTDMVEGAGFYRSDQWAYPTQYINIVRSFADPEPVTLRLEAEGADAYFDTTVGNAGGAYALRDLDVGSLPDHSGWYVGWVEVGEWIEYQQVQLGCGSYRFSARVATEAPEKRLQLVINNQLQSNVTLPRTATGRIDVYQTVHLGQFLLPASKHNIRVRFDSAGGLNLDWIFLKQSSSC